MPEWVCLWVWCVGVSVGVRACVSRCPCRVCMCIGERGGGWEDERDEREVIDACVVATVAPDDIDCSLVHWCTSGICAWH